MKSNYMRAAELKIAKLDPVEDAMEIKFLQLLARIKEMMLQMELEEEYELRNM